MSEQVNDISKRLVLRSPQKRSLEILEQLYNLVTPVKGQSVTEEQLSKIREKYSSFTGFPHTFPSYCFAVATGVGKTRLMGAFIAWLRLVKGVHHFMVIAPNLTVYNKLIQDLTPNTPKYILAGFPEFSIVPPIIITGDNYRQLESRIRALDMPHLPTFLEPIQISVFNIDKINAKESGSSLEKDDVRRKVPLIRRENEIYRESFFNHLASYDDLVILMDEAHHYRASAGMKTINDLCPLLGLELTATPQTEQGGRTVRFSNIVYDYDLANAMDDGFVKEPVVLTRKNFLVDNIRPEELEKIKLEDGVRAHEDVKVHLAIYADAHSKKQVKPFILIIARDINHATQLQAFIESTDFFQGRYRGKVITVHSGIDNKSEKDDVINQLLTVESSDNPIEIVIHVNMLKEGWDVTNLYTIIPLRPANSKTLVEQSIGRGLRLPYGKRTGESAIDQLRIVAHDKFQEIIDYANSQESILRGRTLRLIELTEQNGQTEVVTVPTMVQTELFGNSNSPSPQRFQTPEETDFAQDALTVMEEIVHSDPTVDIQSEEFQNRVLEATRSRRQNQPTLPEMDLEKEVQQNIVQQTTDVFCNRNILIPRITVTLDGPAHCYFDPFELDLSAIRYPVPSAEMVIHSLEDNRQDIIYSATRIDDQSQPLTHYIVTQLLDFDDVGYIDNANALMYFSEQVINHLRTYLNSDDEVRAVLQVYQVQIAALVYQQMTNHRRVVVSHTHKKSIGFNVIQSQRVPRFRGQNPVYFQDSIPEGHRHEIPRMTFEGFRKCLLSLQKFDSYPEVRFSRILENDAEVEKWVRADGQFRIHYLDGQIYNPDFLVETNTYKLIVEVKADNELQSTEVRAKADSAIEFCTVASRYDVKPWLYLLVPESVIQDNFNINYFTEHFRQE